MIIKCSFEDCNEHMGVTGPVSLDAKFICRKHTPASEKDISFQSYQFDKELTKNVKPEFQVFGKSGFQIINVEERASKEIPEWVESDEKIAEIIRRAFPKLDSNEIQRFRAGRWTRIIYLHYKLSYTMSQISEEMLISLVDVKNIINRIKRVAGGRTASNSGKRKP